MNINLNRREFVAKSVWGATASMTLPSFLQQTIFNLDAQAQTLPPEGDQGPIILLMEMAGGNDSLNTVIPYSNSVYTEARPTLHLGEQDGILRLTDKRGPSITGNDEDLALHPNLTAFHELWQDGQLGIINGVGYPNPNLSHFTSFDYWHSAEPNSVPRDGWIGRYLDNQCDGCGATTGVFINRRPTFAFKSSEGISPTVTFNNPANFDWRDFSGLGREKTLGEMYRNLIGLDHPTDSGISETDDTLAYVQRAAHSAMISTASVQTAIDEAGDLLNNNWPSTGLGNSLQTIARLIKGRSQTSIYYARQGGYDTHNNQIFDNASPLEGRHSNLLQDLNNSLGAFVDEMKLQGHWDRVVILTFSEFGRKVIQNGSRGTDHGAAESLFVMGGQVKGNEYFGLYPDLAADARVSRNSMDYNVDFRTVYRTLLEKWMGVPPAAMPDIFPSQPVNFDPLAFL
ncbi:MAG: hypothetical protein CBD18_00275 [Opitutales bacterium TMED158]|nr:MAG: hypothetical protein CBD18_00275 [Opitutales bacterium TMED158]